MKGDVYSFATLYAGNVPRYRALRISLEYHDWCEFERSPVYRELMDYLHTLETRSTPWKMKQGVDSAADKQGEESKNNDNHS